MICNMQVWKTLNGNENNIPIDSSDYIGDNFSPNMKVK